MGDGCGWRAAVELDLGGTHREPGGAPWADGSVSWMAAPSWRLALARRTARRTAAANAVKKRAVPTQLLEAVRSDARRMEEANGAKRRAVPSQLEATRVPCNLEWNANDYMFASLESCVSKSPRSM